METVRPRPTTRREFAGRRSRGGRLACHARRRAGRSTGAPRSVPSTSNAAVRR